MQFVVATDETDPSDAALEHALDIATETDASLTAVYAVDPEVTQQSAAEPIAGIADAERRIVAEGESEVEQRGERVLTAAADRARDRGVEIQTALLYGDPVEAIATYAAENEVDGVFAGHREVAADRGDVMGSVAKGLVDRAPVPVTIVGERSVADGR